MKANHFALCGCKPLKHLQPPPHSHPPPTSHFNHPHLYPTSILQLHLLRHLHTHTLSRYQCCSHLHANWREKEKTREREWENLVLHLHVLSESLAGLAARLLLMSPLCVCTPATGAGAAWMGRLPTAAVGASPLACFCC